MDEHIRGKHDDDQKNEKHCCGSFIELKQVPLDIYGERIIKMSVSSTYPHHRKQWRKVQPKQQASSTQASNFSDCIKEEPVNHCTRQSHERFLHDSTSLSCQEAGYLYPVDVSQANFHRQDSQDIYAEQSHSAHSPVYAETTKELVHNVENMKVTNENGEVIVELYGYQYPIDVSAAIDINGAQITEYKHMDFTYPPIPSPHQPEPLVHVCNKSDSLYSDTYSHKRSKAKDTGKSKCRQKRMQRGCRLWEFIRDLLQNPLYNPSHIKWIDRSVGEFRLVKSNQIARMWGAKKNNECMTYEKLSRAMRYYYKREILSPVLGKRLVYRFGAKSYGW